WRNVVNEMAKSYAQYYQGVREVEKLTVAPREIEWLERFQRDEISTYPYMLYLGCNALMTPHLAIEACQIFRKLELAFVAVGGAAFCCGIVQHKDGEEAAASVMGATTVKKLTEFEPRDVVMICPACNTHFEDYLRERFGLPFNVSHVTQFLDKHIDEINLD